MIELTSSMNLEELWEHFIMLYHNNLIDEKIYETIKQGFDIPIDIREIIAHQNLEKTSIFIKPKNNIAVIRKTRYSLPQFWDEIDKRKGHLRKIILDHYLNQDQTEARIK